MTTAHPLIEVELDPENPAQYFACCGLFELAAMFGEVVESAFDYDSNRPRKARFSLIDSALSLSELMRKLKGAQASTLADSGEAPVTLHFVGGATFTLDWWLEADRSGKSRFKLWAGQQTTLKSLVQPMLANLSEEADGSLFTTSKIPMSGRFGLDPRSAWNTLDFGSSVNEQGLDAYTFPAVEMLAAVGLQGFRPKSGADRNTHSYRLWRNVLPLAVARAVVSDAFAVSGQTFSFTVEKRSGAYSCFAFAHPTQGA